MRNVEQPALRIFLLHSAGGSHLLYRDWHKVFPPDWELWTIEAPGRGRLADHAPLSEANALVSFFLPTLVHLLDRPFAFFGHSMGAVIAYELAFQLAKASLPQPIWVGISARRAPNTVPNDPSEMAYRLPGNELKQFVTTLGGTPEAVLAEPSLWAMIEPVLRADLCASETWQLGSTGGFLAPPLSAFGGVDDPVVSIAQLQDWRHVTSHFLGVHSFPGRHFYLGDCLPALARRIVADINVARSIAL